MEQKSNIHITNRIWISRVNHNFAYKKAVPPFSYFDFTSLYFHIRGSKNLIFFLCSYYFCDKSVTEVCCKCDEINIYAHRIDIQ